MINQLIASTVPVLPKWFIRFFSNPYVAGETIENALSQVKKINKCLDNKSKSIISIFAGRMSDTGIDPWPIMKKAIQITNKKKKVEILWASTREPYNYIQARQLNCQIITMPPKIIEKVSKFGKTFNQLTLDTVKAFLVDSKKSRFKI